MKEISYIKRALLRELSENSRTSVTILAKRLKCSRNTIFSNMKSLEKEFQMFYTLEIDKEAIGLIQRHVWNIKFGIKPDKSDLQKIFSDDKSAQVVAQTEGDFDLFIYVAATSGDDYTRWAVSTIVKLLKYRPSVRASILALRHTGFFRVDNTILEKLDFKKLGMNALDKRIIFLLNENSRLGLSALSKKLNVDVETIRYRVRKLSKSKVIRRFTIILRKPPTKYNAVFFLNYQFAPGLASRYSESRKYYLSTAENIPIVNTFQFLALISGSHIFFGLSCFENEEKAIKGILLAHKEIYKEDTPEIIFAKITNVIKGDLPIRNIDLAKSFLPLKLS